MVAIPGGFIATAAPKKPAYETDEPRSAFMDELSSYGFEQRVGMKLPPLPEIGRLVRIAAPDDKKGKQSGWYIYNEFADDFKPGALVGVGVFGSWKGNPEKETWTSKRRDSMSATEQARLEEQMRAAKISRDLEIEEKRKKAAERAQFIWNESVDCPADHPYLKTKQIKPHKTRISRGCVVVPVEDNGEVVSLQFIDTKGGKKFLSGGKTKGCYTTLGGPSELIYVATGYATAVTIFEASTSMTYVSYNDGNLMEVASMAKAKHPDSQIVIIGDDDHLTDGNPGKAKATAAADALRCKVVFPSCEGTDFNDMAVESGLESVTELLQSKPEIYEETKTESKMPEHLMNPPGIATAIVEYYNRTALRDQPGFAVQTALAVMAGFTQRFYRTENNNHPSMYFMNVAKSGTGKEHTRTVINDIFKACGRDELINGSGYTSSGAIFSALLRSPAHITVLDEFGRYLEASKGGGKGNAMLYDANTQLMQIIGQNGGTARPPAYSTMTLTKEKADEFASRRVEWPAITMVTMTTPSTLYDSIDSKSVSDGFLGRFIIHHSDAIRTKSKHKPLQDVPNRIVEWSKKIMERANMDVGVQGIATEIPHEPATLPFSGKALKMIEDFDGYCIGVADELESMGLAELPGRTKEMAMKMALIIALSCDPDAGHIDEHHTGWAIDYMRFALDENVRIFKMKISGSSFEADKKECLLSIRAAKEMGVTWKEMQKRPPYSRFKGRDLKEILAALKDAELIVEDTVQSGKPGRPRVAYIAVK